MRCAGRRGLAALVAALILLSGCAGSGPETPRLRGAMVVVLGPWTGTEQTRFVGVLKVFGASTGVRVRYVSAGGAYLPDKLDALLARGTPPDVALLPQPGLLRRYARDGTAFPLDAATQAVVRAHYAAGWRALASADGREYGVWFKAANKSLIWYDVGTFERVGVVPPDTLAGLERVAQLLRAGGAVPFAVGAGAADGWVLTDWLENIYLRSAGPQRYDDLAAHRIPWTDPSVAAALTELRRLLAPRNLLGGVHGALHTAFPASVEQAFRRPARAAMLAEGDFVAGFLPAGTGTPIGTQVDVFAFPGTFGGLPVVVGGGDMAVRMTRSPAATALLRFLATPAAAQVWAARGGFVSPNLDLDLGVYPDPVSRTVARNLVEAGSGFRFDLSDLQPAAFGADPDAGMQAVLRRFLTDGDVGAAQQRLESAAAAAYRGTR